MEENVKFRVLLDHIVRKVSFSKMPQSLQDLISGVKEAFGITDEISIQYKDAEFEDFFTLTSTSEIKDKDTLKIVYVEPPTLLLTNIDFDKSTPTSSINETEPDNVSQSSNSAESDDTIILNRSPTTHQPWPRDFPIPSFSYNTEMALQKGMIAYLKDGTLMYKDNTYATLKSNILECLAEVMFRYTPYPSDTERCVVAQALIKKYPCLQEPGSFNGIYGWQQSLKYKAGNYRTKLRAHGLPELMINSCKRKSSNKPAKDVKKAKRCELNYLPPNPPGETTESLEIIRQELTIEVLKKNNTQVINEMMCQTFSIRRQEVVSEQLSIQTIKDRWPALFDVIQIGLEFQRISGTCLESTFYRELDKHTTKLLSLFNVKGGALGQRLKPLVLELIQDPSSTIQKRREVIIRGLIEYMGEKQEDLISDQQNLEETEETQRDLTYPLKIARVGDTYEILIDGIKCITGLETVAKATCILVGVIYALDLKYPPKLLHTFETFQRLFLGLSPLRPKPSVRYNSLLKKLS